MFLSSYMDSISSIFIDNALSISNPMHIFLFARRCYHHFESDQFFNNDLYDLAQSYGLKSKRPLRLQSEKDQFALDHRKRQKQANERYLTAKIAEQHFLGKLASLINFAELKVPSKDLKNARKTVQRLRYYNEDQINKLDIEDVVYCKIHKEPSRINEIVAEYKATNTPPLFLHPKHPEDAINILDETMGALIFSAQKSCDLRCFIQMETIGYNAILAQQEFLNEAELLDIKTEVKNNLTHILDDRNTWINLSKELSETVFDALWLISSKRSLDYQIK